MARTGYLTRKVFKASESTVYDVDLLLGVEIPPGAVEKLDHAIIFFITLTAAIKAVRSVYNGSINVGKEKAAQPVPSSL